MHDKVSSLLSYFTLYFLAVFFRGTILVIAFFLRHLVWSYPGIFELWFTSSVQPFTCTFVLVLYLFTSLVNISLQIKSSVDWLSSSITFLRSNYCSGLELSCNMILNFYPFKKNELALPLSELVILESPLSIYFIFVFIVENVFLVLLISFFVFLFVCSIYWNGWYRRYPYYWNYWIFQYPFLFILFVLAVQGRVTLLSEFVTLSVSPMLLVKGVFRYSISTHAPLSKWTTFRGSQCTHNNITVLLQLAEVCFP